MRKYILILLIFISYFGLSQTSPTYENITIRNQATIRQKAYFIPTISAPAVPFEGMLYADTDGYLYYYNGSAWVTAISHWTLTGSDISNNNTGKLIIPGDSTFFDVMPDVGTKVGRILHVNQYKEIEYITPASLGDRIDSGRAASPTAYSQWVRDSTGLILSLAHPTDTVEIGNTLRFSNNEFAIFKSANSYYFAGANLKSGTGGYNLVGGSNAFYLSTGFGGGNVILGAYAGSESDSVTTSVMIGYYAGYLADDVGPAIFLGNYAGQRAVGTSMFFAGYNAGGLGLGSPAPTVIGENLIGIGHEALGGCVGTNVVGLGYDACWENTGSTVFGVGKNVAGNNSGNFCTFIGGDALGGVNSGNNVIMIGTTHGYDDHPNVYPSTSCINIIGAWDTTSYATLQPGRTYLAGDLQLFQPFVDSCGTGFGSKIYAENNELEMQGTLKSSDSLYVDGNAEFNADVNVTSAIKMQGATLTFSGGGGMASDLDINSYNIDAADSLNTGSISFTDPTVWMDSFRKNAFYFNEFYNVNVANHDPWLGLAVTSGAIGPATSTANHPGVLEITGSGSANSGYRIVTPAASHVIAGGESFEVVFKAGDTTNLLLRIGFIDTFTATDQTDGIYIEINSNTTVRGKTAAATTRSTTATGYVITQGTWYRAKIVVNSDATRVDYTLYSDAGAVLWTNNLTTNIPTDPTGTGFVTLETDAVGSAFIQFDYMSMYLGTLVR